jgi:diguanylate cyclase (GGDEF)-like protein
MSDSRRRPTSIHLAALVLVGLTAGFVTALILITGELVTLWPLYVVPIVIAALTYYVGGAVLASAICAAVLILMHYGMGPSAFFLPELIVGMIAFTISGVVIGVQAHRSKRHGTLLEETSILDPVTGLYKRAHLDKRLQEELRRSERYDLSCSVVLVEIECFDAFKQQFGSYKAELLLEHLGDVLRMSVRDHDIVARYGEDVAFAIVLPFAGAEQAEAVAARMTGIVGDTEFEGDVLEPATHCTVRTSHATYPEDSCERDQLLVVAEDRLGKVSP